MKEFKLNRLLTLKFEEDKTEIYVNEKKFIQCKSILLKKRISEIKEFLLVSESIDILAENQEKDLYLPPETEYWAHCSNLQAWVESDYNPLLLHSNLSIPLLRELMLSGDSKAAKIFKELISQRIVEGNPKVILLLLEEYEVLSVFKVEELWALFDLIKSENYTAIFGILKTLIEKGQKKAKTILCNKIKHAFYENNDEKLYFIYESNLLSLISRNDFWSIFDEEGKAMYSLETVLNLVYTNEGINFFNPFTDVDNIENRYIFKNQKEHIIEISIRSKELGKAFESAWFPKNLKSLNHLKKLYIGLKLKKFPSFIQKLNRIEEIHLPQYSFSDKELQDFQIWSLKLPNLKFIKTMNRKLSPKGNI